MYTPKTIVRKKKMICSQAKIHINIKKEMYRDKLIKSIWMYGETSKGSYGCIEKHPKNHMDIFWPIYKSKFIPPRNQYKCFS